MGCGKAIRLFARRSGDFVPCRLSLHLRQCRDGTPVYANASGSLSKAPYPNDRVLNCTRLVDVTCQGWHVTFVPDIIDLTDDIDFLYVYDGDTLDPAKRIAVFATGDPKPYDGFSGTDRTDWISATTSQTKMTLQFITSGEGYKTNAENYGFRDYFTGTYHYIQCVLDNIDNFEVCEIAGNGVPEGTEECDDGNFINGDGCSSEMKIEMRFCDWELEYEVSPPEFARWRQQSPRQESCAKSLAVRPRKDIPDSAALIDDRSHVLKCHPSAFLQGVRTLPGNSPSRRRVRKCHSVRQQTEFELIPLGPTTNRVCQRGKTCRIRSMK